jgi:hypothetical protein
LRITGHGQAVPFGEGFGRDAELTFDAPVAVTFRTFHCLFGVRNERLERMIATAAGIVI